VEEVQIQYKGFFFLCLCTMLHQWSHEHWFILIALQCDFRRQKKRQSWYINLSIKSNTFKKTKNVAWKNSCTHSLISALLPQKVSMAWKQNKQTNEQNNLSLWSHFLQTTLHGFTSLSHRGTFPIYQCLVLERKECEENLEVVACMIQWDHDVFLAKETHLCWGQALEQTPFMLCNAQPQFLWYGLRSISMSCSEILPSKTHWSIIPHAPVAILLVMWLTFLSDLYILNVSS